MERKKHHPVIQYFVNLLLAVDQLFNTILGGDEDETISSRLGKWIRDSDSGSARKRIAYVVCRMLHWIDKDHCLNAIEEDEGQWSVIRGRKNTEE